MNKCPIHGCPHRVETSRFVCSRHWRQLAKAKRARILDAYERYQQSEIDLEDLRKIQREVLGYRGSV